MYKKGDYVVYKHDVCLIKDIKENKTNGVTYYVMNPIDDYSLTAKIPIDNKTALLRNIISSKEAKKIIKQIAMISPVDEINEKNLEFKYKELLNVGDYESLIKIIKTTYLRNEFKAHNKMRISDTDNTYFNLAEKYLYNELAISLNMTVDEVKEYIIRNVS